MVAPTVTSLLDRPVYGMSQVDFLLGLKSGTARRWIDGYARGGRSYAPVVRLEATGGDIVTWGEFVEARLLAEYRSAGSSLQKMRPAVLELRRLFHPLYPLAHARPFLDLEGRELVMRVQDEVGLASDLRLVVVRNGQIVLTEAARHFVRSATFSDDETKVVERIQPDAEVADVFMDPRRQFGEPVVRSVRTEVIAEQMRAGESPESIAEMFSLTPAQVHAAIRYEMRRDEARRQGAA